MNKLIKNFVGIDISKSWFDAVVVMAGNDFKTEYRQFEQTRNGFEQMRCWLQQNGVNFGKQTLFCMEYTGIYNSGLVNYLLKYQAQLWVEMPLRIKKAAGLLRGSDDKSAAHMIAWYALRYRDSAKLWKPCNSSIEKIKHLITQRERIIGSIITLNVPVNELQKCGCNVEAKMMMRLQQPAIKALGKAKQDIEKLIDATIKADEQLYHSMKLAQSVSGIGQVTATALLVYTRGFTAFENAKQLACYCGVVPFTKISGSSVRYKPSVSPFANMKLKKLLHLCALSAIQNDKEMKHYFERKLLEGKNKMSIINAVRNKLVHRIFAVIRDDRFYALTNLKSCA